MKRLYSLLLAIITSLTAMAFEVDGIYYSVLSSSEMTVTVTNGSTKYTGEVVIPEKVTYNGKEYSVTEIASSAFSDCLGLTSVAIPSSVELISSDAFLECPELKNLRIEDGESQLQSGDGKNHYNFRGCPLENVYLGRTLRYWDTPFRNQAKLTKLTIGRLVNNIGRSEFSGCSGLKDVRIEDNVSVLQIDPYVFFGCSLETAYIGRPVESSPFSHQKKLTSVNIGDKVTNIVDIAFYECSSLTSINIAGAVTSIGYAAFEKCSALSSITIPNSVTSIGKSAFDGCKSLNSMSIPNSVVEIGEYAFKNCSALKELLIEDGELTLKLGSNGYDNGSYKGLFSDSPLETLHLGRTVEYEYSPFQNQRKLTTLTIGDKVTEIGSSAFYGCSALTSVVVPISVTSLGALAFYGCSSLNSIVSNAIIPPSFEISSFSTESYIYALVSVPQQSLGSYIEKWSRFHHLIGAGTAKSAEYHVEPAGSFVKMISPEGAESITSLKLTGTLNGTDLLTINKLINLEKLDIGGCTIVSGGMPYYQTDNERFGTEDNALGHFWSYKLHLLSEVKLPETLTTIGVEAFENKKRLKSIIIPSSVGSIGNKAFFGCSSLTEVRFIDGPTDVFLGTKIFTDCPLELLYFGRNLVYESNDSPFINMSTLSDVTIGNEVTIIGRSAFDGCSALKTITIPGSVEYIDDQAFLRCNSLTNIVLEDSDNPISLGDNNGHRMFGYSRLKTLYLGRNIIYKSSPFSDQSNLSVITIGDKVTSIGSELFSSCNSLTSIAIPNSVVDIGSGAFQNCQMLNSVTLSDALTEITESVFTGCSSLKNVTIPNKVTRIGKSAFESCQMLTDIKIPSSVAEIGASAFKSCISLHTVILSDLVESLPESVFQDCSSLADITIPSSVTTIGKTAFHNCSSLVAITLPLSVTEIGASAFKNCTALQAVTLSESIESLPESVFQNCSSLAAMTIPSSVTSIGASAFRGCSSIESMVIPSSVTKIEDYTFGKCTALTEISLPNTLRSIGNNAFNGCSALAAIAIPNPTESIGERAFDGCSGLKEITLPGSTRSIGQNAFSGCSQLANVYVINPIPPVIESNTFDAATQTAATLHVPEDSKAINWVHPYWGQFKKIENWTVGTTTEFVAENVSYHITSEADATVEISAVALGGSRAASEVKIPATVRFNDKVYTVAGVANNGFAGAQMTEVELPATVNYVGLAAFKGCQALTKVTVLNTLPPSADVSSFDEATYANAKLSVVEEAADAYREHSVWGLFGQTDAPAEEPTDPSDPSDPSDPTDPVDPSDPSDPSDPTDPVDPSDPSDPSDPTDPSGIDGVGTEAVRPVVVPGGIDFEGVDGNTVVEIYSISGQRLYAGPARRKDLAAGYYIVRIGRHAFKIMVK